MKRKLCVLVLSLCMTASLVACAGSKEETSTSTEASDDSSDGASEDSGEDTSDDVSEVTAETRIVSVPADEMDQYITLGEYKGISVEKSVEEVTDAEVTSQINYTMSQSAVETDDADHEIVEGDIANIDYEGKKDGVAFDGGTGEGYDLTIGSGTFIDGFEDGLIGAKAGDTLDLNLTFPEDYSSEELAGQDVVFTVTVNSIKTVPELTDSWVQENTEYSTVDEYTQSVRDELESSNETTAENTVLNDLWEKMIENAEVLQYPEQDIQDALQDNEDSLASYAESQDMTEDEFLESQGMTRDEFDEQNQQYAEQKVKQNLVIQAIMDAEGFTLIDDEMTAAGEELAANYGFDDIDGLVDQYGQDAVYQSIAGTRISNFLLENANVTTVVATEDDKEDVYDADAAEDDAEQEDTEE